MKPSADSLESADSSPTGFEHLSNKAQQRLQQKRSHQRIELQEKQLAEIQLENELYQFVSNQNLNEFLKQNFPGNAKARRIAEEYSATNKTFGVDVKREELKEHILKNLNENKELSIAEQIKKTKERLTNQGKSSVEILQTLIFNLKMRKL